MNNRFVDDDIEELLKNKDATDYAKEYLIVNIGLITV
jgi:hypothetical protein